MVEQSNLTDRKKIRFLGKGSELFGIYLVNVILTGITFGIYGAWAKARRIRFLYGNTDFAGTSFEFHGTGKEIFIGILKTILVFAALYVVYMIGVFMGSSLIALVGSLILLAGMMLIVPFAVHGALRYRLSRTSWRGIHLGYRGNKKELCFLFIKGMLLSMITLGIYSSWFDVRLKRYLLKHVRFGNMTFEFGGDGTEYFLLNLKGILLTIVTLGIYSFWYVRNRYNYFFNNISMYQDGRKINVHGTLTAGAFFKVSFVNILLLAVTFGIAYPWVVVRNMKLYTSNIEVEGEFDPDAIVQTEEDYTNATGEGFFDMLDLGGGLW